MAADTKFKVEIICPDRIFYEGEADMLEFNTTEGEIGIYKQHIPTTVIAAPGVMTITEDEASGKKKIAAFHSGFAEILQDRVTVLAEIIEWPEEIDENRAREAKERAEKRIASKQSDVNGVRAEMAVKRALTRLEVKEK